MILAMMVIYVFILHLVFNVFKWVQPSTRNKIYVTVVGLFFIYCILLVINVFQPMSTDLRVFRYVVPISPLVSGRVADVPIESNTPLEEGALLFQIDPIPYEAQVEQLEAQLELARLRLRQSRALAKQKAGSVYEVQAFQAQVKQLEANLRSARFNLEHTSVRAPSNGHASDIALRPGQVLGPGAPVMSFVSDQYVIGATFRQEVINRIKPGDEAEVAIDTYPGKTFAAEVKLVDRDIPQGQVVASGRVVDTARSSHGLVFVQLDLVDEDDDLTLAAGEAGAATVYTDRGEKWAPVRRVFFRWYTWLNYLITEMDVRGKRPQ